MIVRSANYGSRIDLILCSPGLRPWIKGGHIQASVYGADHCPSYIDLHESIITSQGRNSTLARYAQPARSKPTTAAVYPSIPPRTVPEPPRFATKSLEEFSGRQTMIRSFFGGGGGGSGQGLGQRKESKLVSPSPDRSVTSTTPPHCSAIPCQISLGDYSGQPSRPSFRISRYTPLVHCIPAVLVYR